MRIATTLLAIAGLTVQAAERAQARDQLAKQMEIYVREQMRKARAQCARKFAIAPLPANDIDFIVRYGNEKWHAYKDCLLAELHLDAQHLPPGR
jgi:hypothetical protein